MVIRRPRVHATLRYKMQDLCIGLPRQCVRRACSSREALRDSCGSRGFSVVGKHSTRILHAHAQASTPDHTLSGGESSSEDPDRMLLTFSRNFDMTICAALHIKRQLNPGGGGGRDKRRRRGGGKNKK